jgi:hypothetical protein
MIMKKNFLSYLLMMAFPIAFFSACGDKDKGEEPPKPTTWQDGAGAYKKDGAGILTIGGTEADSTKTVTLATGSGNNAKIILTNLVPDDATVEFDNVEMTKSGNNYTFSSEKTVGTTTITISGTLSGIPATKLSSEAKTLDVKIARKIDSPIVGVWQLNFTRRGGDVFFEANTGDPAQDVVFNSSLAEALGRMLVQKVSNVTATFSEDGLFDVTWIKQGETDPTGMPPTVKEMVKGIMYFASEDQVFIALNKTLIPMLEMLARDMDITPLLASMIDKGDFAALPLSIKEFTGREPQQGEIPTGYAFYMKKEMVLAALPVISPMLSNLGGGQMPPEIGPLFKNLPEIVTNSEVFNVGLNFVEKNKILK